MCNERRNPMRCRICNRKLSNPESEKDGIGPVCRIKMKAGKSKLQLTIFDYLEKIGKETR